MNRLPIFRPLIIRRHPLFFLRYSSKDASSSDPPSPPPNEQGSKTTTTAPAKIPKRDTEILADHKKEYMQVIEPCEMPRQHRKFAEVVAKDNQIRSHMHMRIKKKSWASLAFWVTIAASIFVYSLYAVRQETLLEEISDELAEAWEKGDLKEYRTKQAEEILKTRGRLAYYLYKFGVIES